MKRVILHLDMNSYFATVEQQANPLLRGKPVGICAYLSKNSCIIAASVEAKEFGVKTGMRARDAQLLCPRIVLLENEPAKYRYISEKIFALLAEYSDSVEPYSIDEAFVDFSGWVKDFSSAVDVAKEIKTRIRKEIGSWLRCSVGISFTRWLAKFASEEYKPDGLTVIVDTKRNFFMKRASAHNARVYAVDTIFANRPLTHACGIADRTAARLHAVGIASLGQLQKADPYFLMRILGKNGYYMWAHVNGIEISGWTKGEHSKEKSIGHSYCVPKQGKDKAYLKRILFKLCEKTGRRLREKGLVARSVQSGWDYVKGGGEWRRRTFSHPLFTTRDMWQEAVRIFNTADFTDDVRMVAVSVGSLGVFSPQLSWWRDDVKQYALTKALDDLNSRYGEYTVCQGLLFGLRNQAMDRIGFRKSVEVKRDCP